MIQLVLPDGHRERLRWTDQHPESRFGLGVVLRGNTGALLDGPSFADLAKRGARIECTTDLERRRTAGAIAVTMMGQVASSIVQAFLVQDPTVDLVGAADRRLTWPASQAGALSIRRQLHACGFHGFRLVRDGDAPPFFELGRTSDGKFLVREGLRDPWRSATGRAWCMQCFNREGGDNRSVDLSSGQIHDD